MTKRKVKPKDLAALACAAAYEEYPRHFERVIEACAEAAAEYSWGGTKNRVRAAVIAAGRRAAKGEQ